MWQFAAASPSAACDVQTGLVAVVVNGQALRANLLQLRQERQQSLRAARIVQAKRSCAGGELRRHRQDRRDTDAAGKQQRGRRVLMQMKIVDRRTRLHQIADLQRMHELRAAGRSLLAQHPERQRARGEARQSHQRVRPVASIRERHADMRAGLPSRHDAAVHVKYKAPYERRLRGIRSDLELERMGVHSGISHII